MKIKSIWSLLLPSLLVVACTSKKEFSATDAEKLLRTVFPKELTETIAAGDPATRIKIDETSLEKEGLVTVRRSNNIDSPFIFFTSKAGKFLMKTKPELEKQYFQEVLVARQDLNRIINIQKTGEGTVSTTYTVKYTDLTPFVQMANLTIDSTKIFTANFVQKPDGTWMIEGSR
ncbi:hypothetical protein HGH92_26580 [Chitinophaga varians]|uniref:Uncharacterized protein n=1 Tax=Chitinophaga varians TaxID=2202339 RepID=A0A847RLL8_9BACT|nr:hypothetical protein [Chitinophaga varians]NLR67899.1 hypothetical protein [Chitinophaga varians]